ncbi:MAG: ferrous iron transport protein A [Calditrichaeota bacterium]|nr:ferrous iron transport protein A [Calditrichota bacterium]
MTRIPFVANTECVITALEGDRNLTERMAQMGILPGSRLRIVRVSPLGGTVEVVIDQSESLAIRIEELKQLNCRLAAIPLSQIKFCSDKHYRVLKFLGGIFFQQKMKNRGIDLGDEVEILDVRGLRLKNKNNQTVVIGRGEAEKIILEPLEENGQE